MGQSFWAQDRSRSAQTPAEASRHMAISTKSYLKIDGRLVYLWRAVDSEGEVLDVSVQTRRNKAAALKLMRKLLKKYGFAPENLVTDDLRSDDAAARDLGIEHRHRTGRWRNNRAENSHQPTRRRERKMQGFKSVGSAQTFSPSRSSPQHVNVQRHLISARTHRAFQSSRPWTHGVRPLLQHKQDRQRDHSRLSFDNVTKPGHPLIQLTTPKSASPEFRKSPI